MKATWLTLLLPVIGVFHALGFFWTYGQFREAEGLLVMLWLVAVLLYILALYFSTLFKNNSLRGVKLTFLSLLLSLISGYVGVFLAFNTYGT
jgi:glucan phosphoethanolaminetransferase (alkaline phosphatase superfamily)